MEEKTVIEKVVDLLKENYQIEDVEILTDNNQIRVKGKIFDIPLDMDDVYYDMLASYIAANADIDDEYFVEDDDDDYEISDEELDSLFDEIDEEEYDSFFKESESVETSEATEAQEIDVDPFLITALKSEKDAVETYNKLIETVLEAENPDAEILDCLQTILKDEKEHIALLAALQANKYSDFVGDDVEADYEKYMNVDKKEVKESVDSDKQIMINSVIDEEKASDGMQILYNNGIDKEKCPYVFRALILTMFGKDPEFVMHWFDEE